MAGIGPLSGTQGAGGAANLPHLSPQAGKAKQQDFGGMLKTFVNQVNQDQQQSSSAIQDLLAGKTDNTLPVVMAAAKADMSFKLLIGVRNKMIEAYKQTIHMQI